jgi:hypothetical protein
MFSRLKKKHVFEQHCVLLDSRALNFTYVYRRESIPLLDNMIILGPLLATLFCPNFHGLWWVVCSLRWVKYEEKQKIVCWSNLVAKTKPMSSSSLHHNNNKKHAILMQLAHKFHGNLFVCGEGGALHFGINHTILLQSKVHEDFVRWKKLARILTNYRTSSPAALLHYDLILCRLF